MQYEGGTAPWVWSGSEPLCKAYVDAGGKQGVKFAQCYVFSAVTTSLLRCLGVATRSVTCFDSAHDTQANRVVDQFFVVNEASGELEPDAARSTDSIWNFHVWNDVWMARPDLSPGRGGWQAVDATPQERSGGLFQMGPASLRMVKDGESGSYDVDFVIGEVNADICTWHAAAPGAPDRLVSTRTTGVGSKILTKAVGVMRPENISAQYKHPERSVAERAALHRGARHPAAVEAGPLSFVFDVSGAVGEGGGGRAHVGDALTASLSVTRAAPAAAPHEVDVQIVCASTRYTGRGRTVLKTEKQTLTLGADAGASARATIAVTPAEYATAAVLGGDAAFPFEMTAYAIAKETAGPQMFVDTTRVLLEPPRLSLVPVSAMETTASDDDDAADSTLAVAVGETARMRLRFKNPLPIALASCAVTIRGGRHLALLGGECGSSVVALPLPSTTLGPGEVCDIGFELRAVRPGVSLLVAELDAAQLCDVKGYLEVRRRWRQW